MSRRKDRKELRKKIRETERTLTMEQFNIEYIEDFFDELEIEIEGDIRLTQRANVCNNTYERYDIGNLGYVVFCSTLSNQEWFNEYLLFKFLTVNS